VPKASWQWHNWWCPDNQLARTIRFKRSFTESIPRQREEGFRKNGIDAFHARARFRGPRIIEAEGDVLEGRFILIATGAVPGRLGISGEEHLATSTDFLDLEELPKRLVLVGGGYNCVRVPLMGWYSTD
jgi:glutathione reductase (NADPH)